MKKVFKRKETKFKLKYSEYERIIEELNKHMEADEYGIHKITSLYFDTDDFQFTKDSINTKGYKEKFRIRQYGDYTPSNQVFLEIKRKYQGITDKRRVALPADNVTNYLSTIKNDDYDYENLADEPIHDEIKWMFRRLDLSAKMKVVYNRVAYRYAKDKNFRITFDFDIRYQTSHLELSDTACGELIDPSIDVLMEVKHGPVIPEWFEGMIEEMSIENSSFSKYKEAYKKYISEIDERVYKNA